MKKQSIKIVGFGLSGCILAWQAHFRKYSIEIWQDGEASASKVASGLINPVVLKRLSPVWRGHEFLQTNHHFYSKIEELLSHTFLNKVNIWQKLDGPGQVNQWQVKSSLPYFQNLLGEIHQHNNLNYETGELQGTSWLSTSRFLELSEIFFKQNHIFRQKTYNGEKSTTTFPIVLCQGWKANLEIYGIPSKAFVPVKGEVIVVKLENYPFQRVILHGGIFIIPLGSDLYKIGASYSWEELTDNPSVEGRLWLLSELQKLWKGPIEVINHEAAVRPTTMDRRPLLGKAYNLDNAYIFNGMGSRASLMAPLLAEELLDYIFYNSPLPDSCSVDRFLSK